MAYNKPFTSTDNLQLDQGFDQSVSSLRLWHAAHWPVYLLAPRGAALETDLPCAACPAVGRR